MVNKADERPTRKYKIPEEDILGVVAGGACDSCVGKGGYYFFFTD